MTDRAAVALMWSGMVALAVLIGLAATFAPMVLVGVVLVCVILGAAFVYARKIVRDRSVLAIPVVLVAFTLANVTGVLFAVPGGKYLPLFAVIVAVVAIRPAVVPRFEAPAVLAAALGLLAVGGSVFGRLFLDNPNTVLPIALPLLLMAWPIVIAGGAPIAVTRARMRALSAALSVTVVLIGLAYRLPDVISPVVYNHEKGFLLVGAMGFAVAGRSAVLTVASVAASLFAFAQYPAATYILILGSVAATLVIVLPRFVGPVMPALLTSAVFLVFAFLAFQPQVLLNSSTAYFATVGKNDNSLTREAIYQEVFRETSNPIFSSVFTRDVSVTADLSGVPTEVPAHSDVLTMYLGGGLVGAALFVAIFACATYAVARSRMSIPRPQFELAVVLLLIANAGFFAGLVNPIVVNPTTSVIVFSCLACSLITVRSAAIRRPGGARRFRPGRVRVPR